MRTVSGRLPHWQPHDSSVASSPWQEVPIGDTGACHTGIHRRVRYGGFASGRSGDPVRARERGRFVPRLADNRRPALCLDRDPDQASHRARGLSGRSPGHRGRRGERRRGRGRCGRGGRGRCGRRGRGATGGRGRRSRPPGGAHRQGRSSTRHRPAPAPAPARRCRRARPTARAQAAARPAVPGPAAAAVAAAAAAVAGVVAVAAAAAASAAPFRRRPARLPTRSRAPGRASVPP